MPRRLELIVVVLILFLAAYVRVNELSRLPTGFTDEEISTLQIVETARSGAIGVFYRVNSAAHAGRESAFPFVQTLSGILVGDGLFGFRVVPYLAGLFSVALIYAIGRRLFGFAVGLVAMLLFAFGLYPVLLSRMVLPQSMLMPVYLGAILALTRGIHLRQDIRPLAPHTADFTALAVCATLAVYTHYTGLVFILGGATFVLYARLTNQPISKRFRSYELYAFLMAIILGLPYILSTLRVPELSGFGTLWDQRPATFWLLFVHVFELIRSTLNLGVMGWLGLGITLGAAILLFSGMIRAVRQWRTPSAMLPLIFFGCGLLPVIWTGRADYNLVTVLGPAALLMGIGFLTVIDWLHTTFDAVRLRRLVWLAPLVGMVTLLGLSIELFQRWPTDLEISRTHHGYLGTLAIYLDRVADDLPTLVCAENLTGNPKSPVPDPLLMQMMMHRTEANLRFSSCESAIVLTDGGNRQRIAFSFDKNGQTPNALRGWLSILLKKPVEIIGARRTAVYEVEGVKELASALGKITLSYATWPPDAPNSEEPIQLPIRMGQYLTFEGYETDETRTYKPGDILSVTTYWRIDGHQQDDLRFFTHLLLDPGSAPVAQNDVLDVYAPTLRARDIVIQNSTVQIPYPFPEGAYYLSVGAYHFRTQERVPFYDSADKVRANRIFIGTVTVKG